MIFIKYENIAKGTFISRPNRFIAICDIDGTQQRVHVKNTGRCKKLLTEGAQVILQSFPDNNKRKTAYDLIAVYKNGELINMDSQSPNKAAAEFIPRYFDGVTLLRPEKTYGSSRFDFYIEAGGRKIFMEVKGVTLEENGLCSFPDAPTERGLKHLNELINCIDDGFEAYVLFVIQMKNVHTFSPNRTTHSEFADALVRAGDKGVKVLAYNCDVTEDSMTICEPIKIDFCEGKKYYG